MQCAWARQPLKCPCVGPVPGLWAAALTHTAVGLRNKACKRKVNATTSVDCRPSWHLESVSLLSRAGHFLVRGTTPSLVGALKPCDFTRGANTELFPHQAAVTDP